ncbi:MAG: hypothetical protein V5786_09445 [Psychromonas sp.]
MKKVCKIATVSALVMLSANAMADATGNFQWVGSIPTSNTSDGVIKIIDTGNVPHTEGTIVFSATGVATGEYNIATSSEMAFDVVHVEDDASADAAYKKDEHVDYYYTLTHLTYAVGSSLMHEDRDGQFVINTDGSAIVKGESTTNLTTESTYLTLVDGHALKANEGDAVVVQATLLVSTEAI